MCSELWKPLICCTFFPSLLVADCCLYDVFSACDSADRKCRPYCHDRRQHDNIRQYFIILPFFAWKPEFEPTTSKEIFNFHCIHCGFPKSDRPSPRERAFLHNRVITFRDGIRDPHLQQSVRSWLTWHARRNDWPLRYLPNCWLPS